LPFKQKKGKMADEISHEGIVKKILDNKIIVTIVSQSACSMCNAKNMCPASELQDKDIEIDNYSENYHTGQKVLVTGTTSQSMKALFYGYLLPFILVLAVLITSLQITGEEGLSGLLSIGILVPYYLLLYLFRKNLKKSFNFKIKSL